MLDIPSPSIAPNEVWRHGKEAGALSPMRYLKSFGGPLQFAACAGDDPVPGIVDLPRALARVVAKRLPTAATST